MLGDTQCVGIAYLLSLKDEESGFVLPEDFAEWEWIERGGIGQYVENRYVLEDLKGVEL